MGGGQSRSEEEILGVGGLYSSSKTGFKSIKSKYQKGAYPNNDFWVVVDNLKNKARDLALTVSYISAVVLWAIVLMFLAAVIVRGRACDSNHYTWLLLHIPTPIAAAFGIFYFGLALRRSISWLSDFEKRKPSGIFGGGSPRDRSKPTLASATRCVDLFEKSVIDNEQIVDTIAQRNNVQNGTVRAILSDSNLQFKAAADYSTGQTKSVVQNRRYRWASMFNTNGAIIIFCLILFIIDFGLAILAGVIRINKDPSTAEGCVTDPVAEQIDSDQETRMEYLFVVLSWIIVAAEAVNIGVTGALIYYFFRMPRYYEAYFRMIDERAPEALIPKVDFSKEPIKQDESMDENNNDNEFEMREMNRSNAYNRNSTGVGVNVGVPKVFSQRIDALNPNTGTIVNSRTNVLNPDYETLDNVEIDL